MEGDMWLDSKQRRLMGISGHLTREVGFGGGWLGHWNAGGQFEVRQTEVAPGYWELTLANVNMKGKALSLRPSAFSRKRTAVTFIRYRMISRLAKAPIYCVNRRLSQEAQDISDYSGGGGQDASNCPHYPIITIPASLSHHHYPIITIERTVNFSFGI